jgi:hypothetical protein
MPGAWACSASKQQRRSYEGLQYVTGTSEGAPELLDWPAADAVARDCALRSKDCGARHLHPAQRPRVQIHDFKLNCYPLPACRFARLLLARRRRLALQIWRAVARQNYLKRTVFFFFEVCGF